MPTVLVLNGPNLNLLGLREPELYGTVTLADIETGCHTSVALRDALATVDIPIVDVHLTNIHRREPYRHRSFVAEVADALICGAGAHGHTLALTHVFHILEKGAAA